jgi:hypothetical protein
MALSGQEQTLQVATKPFTLVALLEQAIKVPCVGFQRLWGWDNIDALGHLTFLLSLILSSFFPRQQTTAMAR